MSCSGSPTPGGYAVLRAWKEEGGGGLPWEEGENEQEKDRGIEAGLW